MATSVPDVTLSWGREGVLELGLWNGVGGGEACQKSLSMNKKLEPF